MDNLFKFPVSSFKPIKDCVVVILSIIAILVSVKTCSNQNQSNKLSKGANKSSAEANEIAKEANMLATKANEIAEAVSKKSLQFNIINAEVQWGILRDSYNEIDNKILVWENSKKLKRDGKSAYSINDLETQLDKLEVPDEIRRLYRMRHEKYLILKNVSEQYNPFKERLAHIDFTLPSAPIIPKGSLTFKEGGRSTSFKEGKGSTGFK